MSTVSGSADFLVGDGEMAQLVRSKDWAATPLGPIETWPQSLLTTVSLCLASNFPINIIWGPEASQIYNDGYRVVCGEAHPRALGEDYRVTWASAWPAIGAPFETARAGKTSFLENQRMFLTRNGYLEETFFTFSLSPIRDESGGIGGLFHPVTETTASMLGERRTRALRDLNARLAGAETPRQIGELAAETLKAFDWDLPFVLFYNADADRAYRLTASFGAPSGCDGRPEMMDADAAAPWPIAEAIAGRRPIMVDEVQTRFEGVRCGPYDEPPKHAFILPLTAPGTELTPAIVVAGASPRLPMDDGYRGYFELIGAAIGSALANVRTREEERRRAEALAAIDRAKTAFFSNVSHEFRTPLTLMLGPLEDAINEGDSLPAAQRGRIDIAHRNAQRLMKLVNSLLDFSRLEAGRLQAHFEPIDISALTGDLASNFRSACERAGLELVVDCSPLNQPIYVDRQMWETIVLNLLSNAFKFTLAGRLTVSLRATEGGARLEVADTGIGIPASELDRVFDRFHRIEGQNGRTHEGTGIGLSMVRELVGLHGGAISVASTPGVGATFSVALPAGTAHLNPDRVRETSASPPLSSRHAAFVQEAAGWLPDDASPDASDAIAPEARIIVADDNADMRRYIHQILSDAGYQVETVENGQAALSAARRAPAPDLVLSDVMMPLMDGFQLVEAMRGDPTLDHAPIILLSARAGEEARVEGLASGADDYLLKPFTARELRARVDGVIRLSRQRREAAERERDLHALVATQRAHARLRQTEEELAFALEAGRLGSWDIDLQTGELSASEICRATFGLEPDAAYSRDIMVARIHPDDRTRRRTEIAEAIENGADLDLEYRIVQGTGAVTWVLMRGRAAYDDKGLPVRLGGVSLDITERKLAEERQRLLLDELNHRVKNTLATVQSLALQTRRTARSPEEFNDALNARIEALAGAHDLLTRSSWAAVSLSDLLQETLRPYPGSSVAMSGPTVTMGPNAAVTLNMAFHELATNAAKYGSLSNGEGSIDVSWDIDRLSVPPQILVKWTESDGPMVHPPGRRGFGSRLLEQGVARELGGSVSLDYQKDGLVCRMRLPVSAKIEAPG